MIVYFTKVKNLNKFIDKNNVFLFLVLDSLEYINVQSNPSNVNMARIQPLLKSGKCLHFSTSPTVELQKMCAYANTCASNNGINRGGDTDKN